MATVCIDHEKLAYGLEQGIGNTGAPVASLPADERLRMAPCGLVSSAIHQYAQREGIASRLGISSPKLSFHPEMQHVIAILGEDSDSVCVDASPSQFLMYAGLAVAYERYYKAKFFPPEKIISFKLDEAQIAVDWLTKHAVAFQKINTRPSDTFGLLGTGPLADSSETTMREAYGQIYNPDNFVDWTPPPQVQEHSRVACLSIPAGLISIQ